MSSNQNCPFPQKRDLVRTVSQRKAEVKRCVLGFFKDLFSHLQLQFSLQGLFNYFFTACELNEASTFDYPHGVTIRNGYEWGNSFNYFATFLPFVCVFVVAKGDSEKDKYS